ncbi:MAG: hypothetical protein WAV73_02225 [Candidatus Moraniibacteriota bacterium]
MNYAETETWKTWENSPLGDLSPDDDETKPIFSLLLMASSTTELERLSTSPLLPPVCRLSIELRKAAKRVWRVMHKKNEKWVILSASLEGLDLGVGLNDFYWDRLCRGKSEIHLFEDGDAIRTSPRDLNNKTEYISMPAKEYTTDGKENGIKLFIPRYSGVIYGEMEIKDPRDNPLCYKAEINLNTESDSLRQVKVRFIYHPEQRQIFIVMIFNRRILTESNILTFEKMMPSFSVVKIFSHYLNREPAICYRLDIDDSEMSRIIKLGKFNYRHSEGLSEWYRYICPLESFFECMKTKLNELGIPFADSLHKCKW